ncbi:replication factor C large subunit [Candidatus Woesearchaeota archaeon]|nr:replication factor C large subunit [Candidatus Woesearchaeota archaeon]
MTLPFTQKYAPTSCTRIPQKALAKLKEYVLSYKKQKKRAVLLYGPPGSCKTSSVHALAAEMGYELVEVNASDFRNSEQLEQKVGQACQQASLFGMNKLILVDEIDGLSGTKDRGGIPSLIDIMSKSKFPMVLTANDPWDHKFSKLMSRCQLIEFAALSHAEILPILKEICQTEQIEHVDSHLSTLARRSGGDLRAALNDLHALAPFLIMPEFPELSVRDLTDTMPKVLLKILKTTDSGVSREAVQSMDESVDDLFLWLDENLPHEYTSPKDLVRAYDALSKADVFRGRIRRRQHWRFLVYINDLLSAGVSHAKNQKNPVVTTYKEPMRLLRTWQLNQKSAGKLSVATKLAECTHTSVRKTRAYLRMFHTVAASNKSFTADLVRALELDVEDMNVFQ